MAKPKKLKIRHDGEHDHRGEAEGSKATQFGVGDGRKRPGRPKRSKDERTLVREILALPVIVTKPNGQKHKEDTRYGYMFAQRTKAIGGDLRAAMWLDEKAAKFEPPVYEPDLTQQLLADDQALLAHAYARGLLSPEPDIALSGSESPPPPDGEEDEQP